MYPVLFRVGSIEITSFGVLVALGALVGLWLLRLELRRAGLPESAADAGLAGVAGGLVGAKLLWVFEHLGREPFADLLLSRAGLSWFGGLAGGVFAGLWLMHRRRLDPLAVLAAATPGLAIGHAIGRIGCFLVGDDYGRPTDLPWAIAFPDGLPPTSVPVHPTQLYEAAALVPIALLLRRWRAHGRPNRFVFGAYLTLTGGARFLVELVRVNEPILGALTVAGLSALAAVAVGIALVATTRPQP